MENTPMTSCNPHCLWWLQSQLLSCFSTENFQRRLAANFNVREWQVFSGCTLWRAPDLADFNFLSLLYAGFISSHFKAYTKVTISSRLSICLQNGFHCIVQVATSLINGRLARLQDYSAIVLLGDKAYSRTGPIYVWRKEYLRHTKVTAMVLGIHRLGRPRDIPLVTCNGKQI